jgi:succinoglycan biosynthesis transport protein ExoP
MERIIQPYGAAGAGQPARSAPTVPQFNAAVHPPKSASDFGRALRRRAWLVVAVALVVSLAGTAVVMRMAPVYQATAVVEIKPPQFDVALSTIINAAAPISRDNNELYIMDLIAQLQSRYLANKVMQDLGPAFGDPLPDLVAGLKTQQIAKTNRFVVQLEGRDRERVARLLNALLAALKNKALDESRRDVDDRDLLAQRSIDGMNEELGQIEGQIGKILRESPALTIDGRNRHEEATESLLAMWTQQRDRYDALTYERRMAEMWPDLKSGTGAESSSQGHIDRLLAARQEWFYQLQSMKRTIRGNRFNTDPAAQHIAKQIALIDEEIAKVQAQTLRPARRGPNLAEMHIARAGEEIRKLAHQLEEQEQKLRDSIQPHQTLLALIEQREQRQQEIHKIQDEKRKYRFLADQQQDPVKIEQQAVEPLAPIKPNRPLLIGAAVFVALLLGVALVCLLESLDHSVREPEQLTNGLTLPLFGVVPRMRRLAKLQRGGHLWAPAVPGSLESDAFRNLRASLLGAERPDQPIVTLLVTSAKSGEGKSTVALNMAATCAKAGERTILVDCDLRRPSLAEVFDSDNGVGLVDVLQGLMPWQRAVVRTEIPNLNFLPAGEIGGAPIEVLGSLELRQLIAALAGHYHRVILDGPAVLGLADCRMLGQVCDATLLVVRSGAHELRPLRRAKEMLEQSRVRIAGVVFNGLSDDLDNWSSEGPGMLASSSTAAGGRVESRGRGLDAPPSEAVAGGAGGSSGA